MKALPLRSMQGFTLLEALVALVVLSVGLLGLAALQAQGLRYSQDASVRSQATMFASDLMDRMRALRLSGDAPSVIAAQLTAYTTAPAGGTQCDAAKWNSTAVADEVECWHETLAQVLPCGNAQLTQSAGGGNTSLTDDQFQIDIRWYDRAGPDAAEVDCADRDTLNKRVFWTFQP